jgi:hypothetical protein
MTAAHTPGPWRIEPYRDDHPDTSYFVVGADGNTVCAVENQQDGGVYYEPCKADARLIAAAPEMLEALKLLEAALTQYNLRDARKRFSLGVADAAAGKAIAKAEGREL